MLGRARVKFPHGNGMADRYRNSIGPSVRKFRVDKEWTQEVFAGRLQLAGLHHFSRTTVAKVETQIRSVYDYELVVLAKVLGVDISALFPSMKIIEQDLEKLIGDSPE